MNTEYKYRAFISYSHQDESWAKWLHKSLENYRVPKHLIGKATAMGVIPMRLHPVFRDRDELPSATNLGEVLNQALQESATQIVICSPAAARSKWVNEEILTYKRLGRSDRIFCLIVDGQPGAAETPGLEQSECFPPALRFEIGADGELSGKRAEPIAADAREQGDGKANARLKLISGILGIGYDALKQRDHVRRQRRLIAVSVASLAGMLIASGLAGFALIQRQEAEVQRTRAEAEATVARETRDFLVGLFEVADPSESLGNTITVREILDKGAARIDRELTDQPEIQSVLMETMGTVYTGLGLYRPAEHLLQRALDIQRQHYDADSMEIASALERFADVLTLTANYDEAEKNYRDALARNGDPPVEDRIRKARVRSKLADLLGRMGDFRAAESLFREALFAQRELLGSRSPDVAESLEGLALALYDQGNYEQAIPLLREAVSLRRQLHGGNHPQLAEALNNLGLVYRAVGNYEEAETLYREALSMKRVLLGDEHQEIAIGMNNLAFVLVEKGEFDAARHLFLDAIAMQRQLLGEDHPDIALALNNLTFVLYGQGDLDAALKMAQESLAIYRTSLGDEHPIVAKGMANLGMWLTEKGFYYRAESLLRDSLQLRRQLLGEKHSDTAASMTLLANALVEKKEYAEALELSAAAQKIYADVLSADSWRTAVAMNAQGAALAGLQRQKEAERLLLRSLAILRDDPGTLALFENIAVRRIGEFYVALGRPDQAETYVQELKHRSVQVSR